MLKELKSPQKDSSAWCSLSDKLQLAEDSLAGVRKARKEVVDCMRLLMKLAKEKKADGMFLIIEEMLKKTKLLCSILDIVVVDEALAFLEENKVTVKPEKDEFSESVAEFMQRNRLKIDLQFRPAVGSFQTPCTEFLSMELRTPDGDHFSPNFDPNSGEYGRGYSVFTSGYQSVDMLSDIDEFEESFKCMSVEDKTRHYYTLFRDLSPLVSPQNTPAKKVDKDTEVIGEGHVQTEVNPLQEEEILHEDILIDKGGDISEKSDTDSILTDDCDDTESTPHIGSVAESLNSIGLIPQKVDAKLAIIDHNDLPTSIIKGNESGNSLSDGKPIENDPVPIKPPSEEDKKTKTANQECVDENIADMKCDQGIVSDNETSPHYRTGDEPEPIELTHLNIEAAMMCLASKVRAVSGKANSPTLSNRTFRFKELDSLKRTVSLKAQESSFHLIENGDTSCKDSHSDAEMESSGFKIPDVPKPNNGSEEIADWAAEVRPSMRKLRQGMDSLLKTSRLMCSVLKLQQLQEAVKLTHEVKHRRDVCFSQALTSLTAGLMSRLWCNPPDPVFLSVLTQIGPLVSFEGLLSMHGEDVTIYNDMIVAVEDLRAVQFTLILVENAKVSKSSKNMNRNGEKNSSVVASISSFPLPQITGSRTNMRVLLPVPDWVYTVLPLQDIPTMTFTITPIFFNIGINEQATIADKLGLNGAQERNNSDNFRILNDYFRRYKKLNLFSLSAKHEGNISK